ncbi:hypothetical protein [Paenibacillus sp. J2TS4]|nr:hypothetical protein [Paenibacillus sp. J2TS4]
MGGGRLNSSLQRFIISITYILLTTAGIVWSKPLCAAGTSLFSLPL